MNAQRTLRRTKNCIGIGLHSGQKVTLSLKPAPAGTGLRFQRSDLGGMEITASVSNLAPAQVLQTGLLRGDTAIDTVEHLLSALVGLGIDNALIEMNHSEVPIMDGSAAPWVYLIQDAGIRELAEPRQSMEILRPVQIQQADKQIAIYPSDRFKVTYTIGFDHPILRHQKQSFDIDEQTFINEIAPARTFGFLKEIEMLRQRGLALGGSFDNAIVVGETGVLNALRFEDEFVRHKILDVMGDLALVGHPLIGHVVVNRGGHALHTALAAELLRQPDAWQLIETPSPATRRRAPVRVPATQTVTP